PGGRVHRPGESVSRLVGENAELLPGRPRGVEEQIRPAILIEVVGNALAHGGADVPGSVQLEAPGPIVQDDADFLLEHRDGEVRETVEIEIAGCGRERVLAVEEAASQGEADTRAVPQIDEEGRGTVESEIQVGVSVEVVDEERPRCVSGVKAER